MAKRIIIFLVLNFAALGLGSYFTTPGVASDWYAGLSKAPWTPPGWVFGAAWTTIMICFSLFMAMVWPEEKNRNLLVGLFGLQLVLNISWNPIFFHFQFVTIALIVITALTLLIAYFLKRYTPTMKGKAMLLLPYFIWLIIATSLNAYILFQN